MCKHQEVWFSRYRGVSWSVKCTDVPYRDDLNKKSWTFYLHLNAHQFSSDVWNKMSAEPDEWSQNGKWPIYLDRNYVHNLDWHGGLTFFELDFGQDGNVKGITAGCDYCHLYDEYNTYDFDEVFYDVKRCIDSLWEMYPDLKVWCCTNGKYAGANEGVWVNDNFYTVECQDWREAQGWSRLPEG